MDKDPAIKLIEGRAEYKRGSKRQTISKHTTIAPHQTTSKHLERRLKDMHLKGIQITTI
jgi:hypothetical protein